MSLEPILRKARVLARFPRKRVLVRGESGSGKSRIAKVYAEAANRKLVQVNCALLAPERAASDLFGHVAGAFTGAVRARAGFAAEADGGVLWLDEIHRLPPDAQGMLLTFLDTNEVRPLGSETSRLVDCAVMCSSNEDLRQLAIDGEFARDLYGRLDGHRISIPPLRDRPDDAIDVAREAAAEFELAIAPEALAWIATGAWEDLELPLNGRRLQSVIGEAAIAVLMRGEKLIRLTDLGQSRPAVNSSVGPDPKVDAVRSFVSDNPSTPTAQLCDEFAVSKKTAIRYARLAGCVQDKTRRRGWYLPE